jgi:hypothetical protein
MKPVLVLAICCLSFLPLVLARAEGGGEEARALSVITFPSEVGAVEFPHKMHFNDMELDCQSCHHEVDARKLDYPHEEYFADFWIDCKICHPEQPGPAPAQSCDNCHHDASRCEGCADETLSPKVVIHQSCWGCHEAGTGEQASRSCETCHSGDRTGW